MLKIFLTGDNHIGLKYADHEKRDLIIHERVEALSRMVDKANQEQCELFAITGDLFENTHVDKKSVENVAKILSEFNGIVAIIPGNHDYYSKDVKVWQHFKRTDNIALLNEFKPYVFEIEGSKVVIYPAFCNAKHSIGGANNLTWIKRLNIINDGKYHIGIAHGAIEGETIDKEGKYYLMTRKELNSIPMDAWLIGHTHVPFPDNLSEDFETVNERIFNPGTHVQTDVSNATDGFCFILEIDENKKIKAKKFKSGNLKFFRLEISVKAGNFESDINRGLMDIPNNSIVDISFCGAIDEDEYDNRIEIIRNCGKRFLEFTFTDSKLTRQITNDLIKKDFAETSFPAKFMAKLLQNPKQAQMAYDLLKSIKEKK